MSEIFYCRKWDGLVAATLNQLGSSVDDLLARNVFVGVGGRFASIV